jgi:hypothetical protein
MARERLSRLQRDILAWLVVEDQRLSDTMAASHEDLLHALKASAPAVRYPGTSGEDSSIRLSRFCWGPLPSSPLPSLASRLSTRCAPGYGLCGCVSS